MRHSNREGHVVQMAVGVLRVSRCACLLLLASLLATPSPLSALAAGPPAGWLNGNATCPDDAVSLVLVWNATQLPVVGRPSSSLVSQAVNNLTRCFQLSSYRVAAAAAGSALCSAPVLSEINGTGVASLNGSWCTAITIQPQIRLTTTNNFGASTPATSVAYPYWEYTPAEVAAFAVGIPQVSMTPLFTPIVGFVYLPPSTKTTFDCIVPSRNAQNRSVPQLPDSRPGNSPTVVPAAAPPRALATSIVIRTAWPVASSRQPNWTSLRAAWSEAIAATVSNASAPAGNNRPTAIAASAVAFVSQSTVPPNTSSSLLVVAEDSFAIASSAGVGGAVCAAATADGQFLWIALSNASSQLLAAVNGTATVASIRCEPPTMGGGYDLPTALPGMMSTPVQVAVQFAATSLSSTGPALLFQAVNRWMNATSPNVRGGLTAALAVANPSTGTLASTIYLTLPPGSWMLPQLYTALTDAAAANQVAVSRGIVEYRVVIASAVIVLLVLLTGLLALASCGGGGGAGTSAAEVAGESEMAPPPMPPVVQRRLSRNRIDVSERPFSGVGATADMVASGVGVGTSSSSLSCHYVEMTNQK